MAEKAIHLGGEATADAIVSAVDTMYSEHTFNEKDFVLKHNDAEIAMDSNFAAQSFWKDVRVRFFRKKSAVFGMILVVFIVLLAAFGPGMNEYTYSGQELSQKNFAPRVQVLENFGIFNGDEKMSTTTGSKTVTAYVEKGKEDVYYWFGSDTYGRDIWTRTWEGARVSLIIAVAAAIIDMVIGMSYGLISGYFGGKVDMVMQRFLEVANGIPRLVIVTLLLLVLKPGMITIIFALMLILQLEHRPRRDAQAEGSGVRPGLPHAWRRQLLHHLQGSAAQHHRTHHHAGHVQHPHRNFHRGIPVLCGSGHPGAAVLAGFSDQRAVQQLYHPSLSDHPAYGGHESADDELQPRG